MVCQKVENDAMFHQLVANSMPSLLEHSVARPMYKAQIFAKKFDVVK